MSRLYGNYIQDIDERPVEERFSKYYAQSLSTLEQAEADSTDEYMVIISSYEEVVDFFSETGYTDEDLQTMMNLAGDGEYGLCEGQFRVEMKHVSQCYQEFFSSEPHKS